MLIFLVSKVVYLHFLYVINELNYTCVESFVSPIQFKSFLVSSIQLPEFEFFRKLLPQFMIVNVHFALEFCNSQALLPR